MPFPDNWIEKEGVACTIYTVGTPSYDSDYGEIDYDSVVFTTQTAKIYLVPDAGPSVNIYEIGWSDLPVVTAWMKAGETLSLGDGPEHDIIKITESGHRFEGKEFDLAYFYRHPKTGHYEVLLEPRSGTNVTS